MRQLTTQLARVGCALAVTASIAAAQVGTPTPIRLVSANSSGLAGNGPSNGIAVSTDGGIAAFYSDATDLVPGDTNQMRDVFVRDLSTGLTERVSVSSSGAQANGVSHNAYGGVAISGNGQIVAFYSQASNLVANDTNRFADVFVRLRGSSSTQRVSVASDGTEANGASVLPSISADGRYVVFQSEASNLVAGDTNRVTDIFVHDRVTGTTTRVCNVQGDLSSSTPVISADGSTIAFASSATNLVSDDTNNHLDIFVCDRVSGVPERISLSSSQDEGNGDSILPALSATGRFVGFKSLADNLVDGDRNGSVDVFVRDRQMGKTERISVGVNGGDSSDVNFPPTLSNDGRFVAFASFANNLIQNDYNHSVDVFVRDRQIGVTVAVRNDAGDLPNGSAPDVPPSISGDGKQVGFTSLATNLVVPDRNEATDSFVATNPFYGPGSCPDGTCPDGNVCVAGFCAVPTKTPTITRTPTPTKTGTATKTPTPTATFRSCTDDSQCRADEHCRAGFCKKKRPCDDTDPTIDRLACFGDRETCIDNLCECGGDCNRDGVVLTNEITKAVLILAGIEPITSCTAADINSDGQVLGNEITLSVINLGEGCTQEGQPLMFAHDRGEKVALKVSSGTSGQGSTIPVTVDMSGGGGDVATAQIDLLFDPTVLHVPNPGAACHLDDRLASNHILAATITDTPPAPPGLARLRLFVGDIVAPIDTFADGRLVTCEFEVAAEAQPGMSFVVGDRLNIGDARGSVFDAETVDGSVTVSGPAATPTPAAGVTCAGDCDGDGEVFGNEITQAVRILAGEAPRAECEAADADGDGEVFVTDVTQAIMHLGRGCPR